MNWSFASGRKLPLLLFFNWKSKYHCNYYCTKCYLRWSWKPWNSTEHKELPYYTGVCHWCRWIYVKSLWHGWINQQRSYVTRRRIYLGGIIPSITRLSWYGRCRRSIKFWKGCWRLWSVFPDLRYVSLVNEGEKFWPESPSVWSKTRANVEGLNIPYCFQITHYMRFHFPMSEWKSWQQTLLLRTCYPR